MGGVFSKPKKPKPPPIPSAPALPEVGPEVSESAVRQARRRGGFEKTIITGELEPKKKKRTVLG